MFFVVSNIIVTFKSISVYGFSYGRQGSHAYKANCIGLAYLSQITKIYQAMNFPFNPSKFSLEAISANPGAPIDFSNRANFLVGAAEIVSRECCPKLTPWEWEFLAICALGAEWPYASGPIIVMQAFVQRVRDAKDEALMFRYDNLALAQRLDSCTFAELFSVFEVLFRYLNLEPHEGFPRSTAQVFLETIEHLGGRINYDQ